MAFDSEGFFTAWTALVLVSAGSHADPESAALCGGALLEVEGELTSPGHPGPYPDRAACRWALPTGPGDRTTFRLFHLDIEYESVCAFDRLTVSFGERGPGAGGTAAPHRVYCGSNISLHVQPFVGAGPATVLFHSDDSVTRTGFRLHYAVLQENPPCDSRPCRNGGRCRNRVLGFACVCAKGFQGSTCEQGQGGREDDTDEWGLCQPNPCHHGGSCRASRRQFHCLCARNYTGSLCQHDIDSAGLAALLGGLVVAFGVSLGAVTLYQLKIRARDSPERLEAEPCSSSTDSDSWRQGSAPTTNSSQDLRPGHAPKPVKSTFLSQLFP